MPPTGEIALDPLTDWCLEHLGSAPADELFRSGHLSTVVGVRLADGREVVVKIRPDSPRMPACVDVQRRMFLAGYPCPRPLTDALPFGTDVATAEDYVPGGTMFPTSDAATAFAEAFAWLIRIAPGPGEVSTLDPPPSWVDWNQPGDALWPWPEDHKVNLNEVEGAEWIDDAGHRARDRLRAGEPDTVIGHCDWLASNLRWRGDTLLVVHDWDSVVADSEAVLVGFAAALFSTDDASQLATVEDTERSSPRIAMREAANSPPMNCSAHGLPVSGPEPTMRNISTQWEIPSRRCRSRKLRSAFVVPVRMCNRLINEPPGNGTLRCSEPQVESAKDWYLARRSPGTDPAGPRRSRFVPVKS